MFDHARTRQGRKRHVEDNGNILTHIDCTQNWRDYQEAVSAPPADSVVVQLRTADQDGETVVGVDDRHANA